MGEAIFSAFGGEAICVLYIAQQQKQHLAIQFAAFLDAPFYCAK